jgi:rhodanese-related sulfurtransferase
MQACTASEILQNLLVQSPDSLIIIDVRTTEEFQEYHIPQAINIPIEHLEERSASMNKDATVFTVCGKGGGRSAQAAARLEEMGFKNSFYLCGGTLGWPGQLAS